MRTKKEMQRHLDAFEVYYVHRSLRKVAQLLGVSLTSLNNWSSSFNWQERCEIRDAQTAAMLNDKSTLSNVERKAKYLKHLDSIFDSAFDHAVDGTIKPKIECSSARDLKAVIDSILKLLGEPEQEPINITFNVTRTNTEDAK
jgi:hypothetical protein